MKRKYIIIGSLVVLLACVLGYLLLNRKEVTNGNQVVLRIPDAKFMGLLPLYVADEKGFFAKQGIKVEWVEVSDPGQAEKVFLSNGADLLATTFANSLQAEIRQPGTIKFIVPTSETSDKPGSYLLLNKDSKIASIQDLKGKKIGTYSGPSQKAYAQIFLAKQGLVIDKDYELIQVASSAQIQALFGGTYDALFTVEPYGAIAINQGAKVLVEGVRTKYISNPFWIGAFAVKSDFANDKEKMRKILDALNESIDFIQENDLVARETLINKTNTPKEVVSKIQLYNWTIKPSENDLLQMQSLIDILANENLLEKKVEVKPLIYINE